MRRIICILSLLALVSCTRVTDLRPESGPQLVVVCILAEEEQQELSLSLTDVAGERDRARLNAARISLYDLTLEASAGFFRNVSGEEWTLDYRAIPEHTYRLEVSVPGFEDVYALTTMPQQRESYSAWNPNPIISSYSPQVPSPVERGTKYRIEDLPDGPIWIFGMNYDPESGEHAIAETIATSIQNVDNFNLAGGFYVFSGDRHGYDFVNGHIYGMDVPMYYFVEGQPLHWRYIRVPSVEECGPRISEDAYAVLDDPNGRFSVAGSFSGDYWFPSTIYWGYSTPTPPDASGYIVFMSVSAEYDIFLKAAVGKQMMSDGSDYTDLFRRDNSYTNIVGGMGIFGAKTLQHAPWNDHPV